MSNQSFSQRFFAKRKYNLVFLGLLVLCYFAVSFIFQFLFHNVLLSIALLNITFIFLFVVFRSYDFNDELGFGRVCFSVNNRYRLYRHLFVFAALMLLIRVMSNMLSVVYGDTLLTDSFRELQTTLYSPENIVLMFVFSLVLSPLAEEFIMRGIMLPVLRNYFGFTISVVLTSVFFGAMHGTMLHFIMATALGFVLSMVYATTDSILLTVLFHFVFNVTGFVPARAFFPAFLANNVNVVCFTIFVYICIFVYFYLCHDEFRIQSGTYKRLSV